MSRFIALSALCVYLIKYCSHATSDAALPAVHISPRYIELPGSRVISLQAGGIRWQCHWSGLMDFLFPRELSRSPIQGPFIDKSTKYLNYCHIVNNLTFSTPISHRILIMPAQRFRTDTTSQNSTKKLFSSLARFCRCLF